MCGFCSVSVSVVSSDVLGPEAVQRNTCLQLAVLTVPTEVGDQGTAKMPLTKWRIETRESAMSATTEKMPSLQQITDRLQWLELTTAYELNTQSRVNNNGVVP